MRILITGGAGFIGSHLAEMFLNLGHHVTALDNLSTGHRHLSTWSGTCLLQSLRSCWAIAISLNDAN